MTIFYIYNVHHIAHMMRILAFISLITISCHGQEMVVKKEHSSQESQELIIDTYLKNGAWKYGLYSLI